MSKSELIVLISVTCRQDDGQTETETVCVTAKRSHRYRIRFPPRPIEEKTSYCACILVVE